MKVLVVGGGGREHALAWKLIQSPEMEQVFVAPGNAGTYLEAGCENIDLSPTDFASLIAFAKKQEIRMTIVGPEDPLVAGIVDRFTAAGLKCFGPGKDAAQLEGSKAFAKEFMNRHGIPTAGYRVFESGEEAKSFVSSKEGANYLICKADGLAAGKGVIVGNTPNDILQAIDDILVSKKLGDAGNKILLEEKPGSCEGPRECGKTLLQEY